MKQLRVNLQQNSYDIHIQRGISKRIPLTIRKRYGQIRIGMITDRQVWDLYGQQMARELAHHGFQVKDIIIPGGESSKTLHTLELIYHRLTEFNLTREDMILTLGGGVVGDVGGFAAATYLRGVPYLQIPTTLLSQIDSSVGGKVGVNLLQGKNLIGSFYHPREVFIDPDMLDTLEPREFNNGLAEAIKYGCIADRKLFETLGSCSQGELYDYLEEMIYRCCNIKAKVVESDERDLGSRMILNFGHTLGHALEGCYSFDRYTHGEAVAIGMMAITQRSEDLGLTKKGTAQGLKEVLEKYHLPTAFPSEDWTGIRDIIHLDKKSRGEHLHIVLLEEMGKAFIKKIVRDEISRYLFGGASYPSPGRTANESDRNQP